MLQHPGEDSQIFVLNFLEFMLQQFKDDPGKYLQVLNTRVHNSALNFNKYYTPPCRYGPLTITATIWGQRLCDKTKKIMFTNFYC